MRIFGKDGDGYELTIRLENAGSLREWLGSGSYAKLMPYLTSQATWHSFMNSTSTALLNLQMRVRALLFDKAAGCVYEDYGETIAPSSLNPSYLQLNGNAVYFPLDQDAEDFKRYQVNANRTPTTPLRHQQYSVKGQVLHGRQAHNGARRNLEDDHESKGGLPVSQQRHASQQGGHGFNNMINSKQEMSKPSLNKVKKVEAWDSSDASKRPMEMIGGTINKKLRSPKISSKATFQTDGTGIPIRDHQEKMASHKTTGGFARKSDESSKVSISASIGRAGHAIDTGDVGPLWYDQCAKIHLNDRMQRLSQRAAQQKLPFPEREGFPRTPEGMVAYIEFNAKRQKTMSVMKQDPDAPGTVSNGLDPKSSIEFNRGNGDPTFVSDLKFLANCVPDNPVPAKRRRVEKYGHQPKGLLDNLDDLQLRSPRASKGVGSEEAPLTSETQISHGKCNVPAKKEFSVFPDSSQSDRPATKVREHCADHMLRQTVAKLVADAGFEGLKQSSLDLFVDVLDSRFKKLSTGLRGLIDSYRRQCSQAEYLKMFMQVSGSSMEDMMEQVKEGVQKQQLQEQQRVEQQRLEQEELQLRKQQQEQEELVLEQTRQRKEEEFQQQQRQREEEELQHEQQQEEEKLSQQKPQREEELLKQRQGEERQSHQQQQQNPLKQRPFDQQQSTRRPDLQHSQHKLHRQPEKQPLQPPQHQQLPSHKQRQIDQQHSQQQQQQHLQRQRQPEHQPAQQQQQQQQSSHFPIFKRRPKQTPSPSRQSLSGKPAGMRSPPAPPTIDSVLKQARKACSETMEQHKQKADEVMGLIKQHPQKMSQMSMLAHAQRQASAGSPTKGFLTKSPDAFPGLQHQRQPVPQQSSADKGQKRKQQQQANMGRHSPNMGRSPKKGDKERPLDGKSQGDSRPMVGKKAMQMMSGGNSSSWHPSIPMVKSQTSPMLQHVKQQASSLQP